MPSIEGAARSKPDSALSSSTQSPAPAFDEASKNRRERDIPAKPAEPHLGDRPPPSIATTASTQVNSGGAAVGGQLGVRFLDAKEVDHRAIPIMQPPIEYPAGYDPDATAGILRLAVSVSADGDVVDVEVLVRFVDEAVANAAVAAFKATKFLPARKAKLPVPSRVMFEVVYGLAPAPNSSQSSDIGLTKSDSATKK